jgi:nucleoside phosphorylase
MKKIILFFIILFINIKLSKAQLVDIDGNVYQTERIGVQNISHGSSSDSFLLWTTSNLNVSKFKTGEAIIEAKSSAEWQDIKAHQRKVLGVEMEAYGLYYAAENGPNQYTKAIMIKSVSDFGDSTKNDSYQEYAAYTSSQFIYQFIMEEFF